MASAKLKAAVKRIKGTLDRNYETSVTTPTAGPVGSGKLFIGGQVFDGDISGVTQVVNVGRPAAAQYAAKYGGGGGTTVVSGGSSTASVTLSSTPGTLSATTINDASGSHTHAIDASAAPGAAEYLLKSSSAGNLTLPTFTASTSITTPSLLSVGDLTITPAGGDIFANALLDVITGASGVTKSASYSGIAVHSAGNTGVQLLSPNTGVGLLTFGDTDDNDVGRILYRHSSDRLDFETGGTLRATLGSTYTWDVTGTIRATTSLTIPLLTTATNVDLIINPAGTGAVQFPNDQTLRTTSFDSSFPVTGWQINEVSGISGYSSLTIGKIQADELAVRVFVADEVRVDRGDEYWTKSYGIVATTFTTPSTIGGTVSVKFEDSPALAGAIFTNNDWVLIRKLDIDTGITLSNVWGQVATYVSNSDGTQNWTFTLRSGPTSESITKGSLAIDFGASGAALIHLSVIDSAGAPYIKMRKWAGANPYTPSNFTTYIQLGNLNSTGNSYYTPSGYGLYIRSTAAEDQFMVADDNGLQIRGPSISLYNSTTQTILMNNTSGINVREDVWGSWDNRRALQWWPDVASMSGDPSLSVYTGKVVGGLTANQNFSYIDANPTGNVLAGLSITAFGQGTATDATLYLEGGSQSLTTTPSITMTATNIDMIGAVDVTGSLSVGGTAVSLSGHTHSYLPLAGGTLSGAVITDIIRPATHNTKTVGSASIYYSAGYFDSLYVNTIVGTPSYSHTHSASDITSGTLDFARMATTWTGALTMDADAAGGNSNYIRWLTQTSTIKAWDLIGRAHDYATTAQQNDLLLTYTDNTTTYIVFQADNATRIIDFLNTPTVGGTAVSLSGHTHDDRYYTETEVNSLLSGYVPTSRTVTAGSGLTGGGALSTNITLNLDTPGSLSVSSSNSASGNHAHAITASSAPGAATSLLKSDTSGNLTLPTFAASTSVTTPLLIATNRLGISTGTSGVTESTAYNGVYVHAAGNAAVQLLTPNTSVGLVTFGDPEDNDIGRILYRHSTDVLDLEAGASLRLRLGGATYAADVTGALRATGAIYADAGMTTSAGNLTLTSTGGTVAVTGALTGSSTGVFTSTLTAASDTDAINAFGRVRLGYAAATDTASFSHFDNNTSTNFALSQSAAGATTVNAASGQTVDIQVAGVSQWTASSSRLNPRSSVVLDIGDYNRRVRTLHAAELAVETLVAQNIMATIGGRIIVAPTVKLIADLANSGTATSFNTNLTAYWSLDEASGNRSDSRGTQTLTDTNTVASTSGKKSSAANFTGSSSEKLNRSDNSTLSVGDIDFFFSLWIYPTLNSGSRMTLINKGSSGSGEYRVEIDWATSTVRFLVANAALASTEVTSSVTISTNSWYFVTAWHDSVNNVIGVGVNGNEATAAHTTGVRDSTGNFCLGARDTDQYYTGYMDEVGFWKNYIPSAHERRWLYNQYTGRAYTEINTQVQSTIDVDGNSFASGDFIYLSAAPGGIAQVESMMVSSSASAITGGYRYTVVRDHDGSGLNSWYVGDAAIDIGGTSGGGYIDLTSTSTIQSHYGPTIAVYQRDDYGRWNDVVPTAALGNLRSFLDYAGDTSGMAVGNDLTLTPSTGFKGLAADATNGLRLFNTDIELYSAGTQTVNIDSAGTDIWVGPSSADKRLHWNGTSLNVNGAITISAASGFSGSGYLQVGTGTKDSSLNGFNIDSSEIVGQASGVDQVVLGTDGKIKAGAGNVVLDSAGISVIGGSSFIIKQDSVTTKGYIYSQNPLDSLVLNATGVGIKTAAAATTEGISLKAITSAGNAAELALNAASSGTATLLVYPGTAATAGRIQLSNTSFSVALNGISTNDFSIDGTSAQFNTDVDLNSNDITDVGTMTISSTAQSSLAFGLTNYYIGVLSNVDPLINFDATDYLAYSRSSNALTFTVGGTTRLTVNASGVSSTALSSSPAAGTSALSVTTPTNQSAGGIVLGDGNCGSSFGPFIAIGRNNNGSTPSAGWLRLFRRDGSTGDLWVDASGNLRIGQATAVTNATDSSSGVVVGTQTSSLDTKNIIEPFTDNDSALNAIVDAPLYDFTYKSGAFNGQRFTGIVTDYAPTFGMDRDEAHPAGKSLNEVTAHGYTFAAIKALHSRIEQLEKQVKELQHA